MTLYNTICRRFSGKASSTSSPTSPDSDCRRSSLFTDSPVSPRLSDAGPFTIMESPPSSPPGSSHDAQSQSNILYDPHESKDAKSMNEYSKGNISSPTDDLVASNEEMSESYPLERQPTGYIYNAGGYTALATRSSFDLDSSSQENHEKPIRKLSQQVSGIGRQASIVGRCARALPGNLSRGASKLFRSNMAQDVVRPEQRSRLFEEKDWDLNGQVDMGRDVSGNDRRSSVERGSREIEWDRLSDAFRTD